MESQRSWEHARRALRGAALEYPLTVHQALYELLPQIQEEWEGLSETALIWWVDERFKAAGEAVEFWSAVRVLVDRILAAERASWAAAAALAQAKKAGVASVRLGEP